MKLWQGNRSFDVDLSVYCALHWPSEELLVQADTGKGKSRSATPSGNDGPKRSAAASKRKADAQPADAAKRVRVLPYTCPFAEYQPAHVTHCLCRRQCALGIPYGRAFLEGTKSRCSK